MLFRPGALIRLGCLALLLSIDLAAAQTDPLANGRSRTAAFLAKDIEPLWRDMTAPMKAAFVNIEGLRRFRTDLEAQLGGESQMLAEDVSKRNGFDIYTRSGRWSKSDAEFVMQWTFDSDGRIAGFFVRPKPAAPQSRYVDYQTKTPLTLPFADEWFVFWGGRTPEQNYHATHRAQRFAVDLVIRKDGATFTGDSSKLTSYHCWDTPILAPADGTVVFAVPDMPDLPIGQSDQRNPAGNHVVLDLGNSEFAFMAHFQKGSVTVKHGERVVRGQEVGRCGNSGNTSEPHLHFHLQTTPDLASGEGLPAYFENYLADGAKVARSELLKGQAVRR